MHRNFFCPCLFRVSLCVPGVGQLQTILLEVELAERFRGKKGRIVVQWHLQEQQYQQLFSFVAEDKHTPAHTVQPCSHKL